MLDPFGKPCKYNVGNAPVGAWEGVPNDMVAPAFTVGDAIIVNINTVRASSAIAALPKILSLKRLFKESRLS
jgi:hypothetical protein